MEVMGALQKPIEVQLCRSYAGHFVWRYAGYSCNLDACWLQDQESGLLAFVEVSGPSTWLRYSSWHSIYYLQGKLIYLT